MYVQLMFDLALWQMTEWLTDDQRIVITHAPESPASGEGSVLAPNAPAIFYSNIYKRHPGAPTVLEPKGSTSTLCAGHSVRFLQQTPVH